MIASGIIGYFLLDFIGNWHSKMLSTMFASISENTKFKVIFDNQDESVIIIKKDE